MAQNGSVLQNDGKNDALWKSGEARECFDKVERGGILLRKVAEILSGVSGTKVPSTTLNIPRKKLKRTLSITSAPFEGVQTSKDKTNAENEHSIDHEQNLAVPRTVFDMFTEFVKRAEMKRDDIRSVALPQEKRQRRKGRPPTGTEGEDNLPSPSMLADPNFICLNRMTRYRFVKNRRGTNNVAVFVDDEHVRLYRPTNHSKHCAYYRCSTCDRLYQERGEGPRPTFKIINGVIRCAGNGHFHSEDCKPLSCVEMRVKELDYEARLQISRGLLKPREAWSNARMQWLLDNENQGVEADGFPSWQAVRSSYNRRKRSFKKALARGLIDNQSGSCGVEYTVNGGREYLPAVGDGFGVSDPDLQMDLHSSGTTEQDVDQEVLCEKQPLSEVFRDPFKALMNAVAIVGDVELPKTLGDAQRTVIANTLEKMRKWVNTEMRKIALFENPEYAQVPESETLVNPGALGIGPAAIITTAKLRGKHSVKNEN